MATTYKQFTSNDIASNRTLLHESIPITGSMLSGTYIGAGAAEENVKTFSHGMFQSVYDYPFLSSSSNHLMDITLGFPSTNDVLSQSSPNSLSQQKKKINIYNQMAQVLVGYDQNGLVRNFDQDGDFSGGETFHDAFFINLSRLLTKDEIKKGSFSMEIGVDTLNVGQADAMTSRLTIADVDSTASYKINSPAGEYGILYATSSTTGAERLADTHPGLEGGRTEMKKCGLIYYQAGIIVLSSSIFNDTALNGLLHTDQGCVQFGSGNAGDAVDNVTQTLKLSTINENANFFRSRIFNMSFNNTTELNSTIHFCRASHNEFNYSANPSYLESNSSKIVVKESTLDNPVSYITTIGLYSTDNELLAVAKLSEPIKKDPTTELTFRVRLDY